MIKRGVDFCLALVGLVVLAPAFALIALWVKLGDGGPVFFTQTRVGLGGQFFKIIKFRSMIVRAGAPGSSLTVGADRRITPVGEYLRRLKLDELPQLFNVLGGSMSLVGPRPEVPMFVMNYSASGREVLKLKPGITDPASFAFFDESEILSRVADPEAFYREHIMVEKIRINLDYAGKATLRTDLVLILATVARAFGFHLDIFSWLKIVPPILPVKENA